MRFDKDPKTIGEQIDILSSRGICIPDPESAAHYLQHLGYYRLSGYWIPFEECRNPHHFRSGTRFEQVLNLYAFDRELRLLVLDAIERIEVSARTQWAYQLALDSGAHAHCQSELSNDSVAHRDQLGKLKREIQRSSEVFVAHYQRKYSEPKMPPIWASCELLSLGQLSKWYETLRPYSLRKKISSAYQLPHPVFESLLHHLNYVRNLCAHHSRVWNRDLTILPKLPRNRSGFLKDALESRNTRKIYNSLVFCQYLMNFIAPSHQWHSHLKRLIETHDVDASSMGFPPQWKNMELWR